MMSVIAEKYLWTQHARMKMRHYRLTESRIKRIIRHPARVEEGIAEGAVACMQPAGGKRYSEIWTMYIVTRSLSSSGRFASPGAARSLRVRPRSPAFGGNHARSASRGPQKANIASLTGNSEYALDEKRNQLKVITAWRYPGKSPERDPIPPEVLREIRNIISS